MRRSAALRRTWEKYSPGAEASCAGNSAALSRAKAGQTRGLSGGEHAGLNWRRLRGRAQGHTFSLARVTIPGRHGEPRLVDGLAGCGLLALEPLGQSRQSWYCWQTEAAQRSLHRVHGRQGLCPLHVFHRLGQLRGQAGLLPPVLKLLQLAAGRQIHVAAGDAHAQDDGNADVNGKPGVQEPRVGRCFGRCRRCARCGDALRDVRRGVLLGISGLGNVVRVAGTHPRTDASLAQCRQAQRPGAHGDAVREGRSVLWHAHDANNAGYEALLSHLADLEGSQIVRDQMSQTEQVDSGRTFIAGCCNRRDARHRQGQS